MGEFPALQLSGGEPFLREDIDEICHTFYHNNKVRHIGIPTNALLTDRIMKKTRQILEKCPELNLTLSLSIDAKGELHDKIRGVKGNFDKAMFTEKALREIKKEYPHRFNVNTNTTVFNTNINHLQELVDYLKHNTQIDTHGFEMLRGNPLDPKSVCIKPEEFGHYKKIAMNTEKHYFRKKYGPILTWYIMARKNYFYNIQRSALKGEKSKLHCLAGTVAGVITEQGDVAVCELYPLLGNLKDNNYDMKAILNGPKAQEQKKKIKDIKCNCTHCVYQYQNIEHNWFVSFIKIPLIYLFAPNKL
jgi:MoaA/NifB/PqqE/SkfB family radical SAM enzyme